MKRTNHLGIAIKNVSAIGSCPLIDAMAERIVNDLEWSAESEFDNCEEDIIISLIAESYRREAYTEAINILILTFSLIHNLADVMLLDIIGSCPEIGAPKMFLDSFLRLYGMRWTPESFYGDKSRMN